MKRRWLYVDVRDVGEKGEFMVSFAHTVVAAETEELAYREGGKWALPFKMDPVRAEPNLNGHWHGHLLNDYVIDLETLR